MPCHPTRRRHGWYAALLYSEPSFYADEPRDSVRYATRSPDFPYVTTGDQLLASHSLRTAEHSASAQPHPGEFYEAFTRLWKLPR